MKVEQFKNKNQFHLYEEGKHILQSYNSTVVVIEEDKEDHCTIWVTLGRDWDYSNTTRKHVYLFLEEYLPYGFNVRGLINAKNKRDFVQKMIDNHEIGYDKNLV